MSLIRKPRFWALVAIVVGYVLRIWLLNDNDLWWDEALAVFGTRKSLIDTTLWTASDVHPPLYFWTLWLWMRIAGETPFAMRYLSLCYGVLLMAMAYPIGTRLMNTRVGVVATWLIALARFEVWWSQEMRMYMLSGMLGTLAIYATLRIISQPRTRRYYVVYALACIAAMHTIYISAMTMIALSIGVALMALTWLIARRACEAFALLLRWTLANLAVIAAMIPWFALSLPRQATWSAVGNQSLDFGFRVYGVLLASGVSLNIEQHYAEVGILLALIALGVLIGRARHSQKIPTWWVALTLALGVLVPPGVLLILSMPGRSFYVPQVEARYFLPFALFFYALLAWGLVRLYQRQRWLGIGASLIAAAILITNLPGYYALRHTTPYYAQLTQLVRSQAREGDIVVLVSGDRYPEFLYRYAHPLQSGYMPPLERVPSQAPKVLADKVWIEFDKPLKNYKRLWLVLADPWIQDPDNLAEPYLRTQRPTQGEWAFGPYRVLLF